MAVLTVPKELRTSLGEQGSDALVIFINEALNEQKNNIIELNAELFESKLIVGLSNLEKKISSNIEEKISSVEAHISLVEERISSVEAHISSVEERFETKLNIGLANLRSEFKADIANLRSEFKADIANLRTEFKSDIADTKISLIKWMIGIAIAFSAFNITVLSVILSILIK